MAAKEIGVLFIKEDMGDVVSAIYDVENNCTDCLQNVLEQGFVPVLRIHSNDAGWYGVDAVGDTKISAIALKVAQERVPEYVREYWSR